MNVIERDAARAAGSAIGQPDKPTAPEPTERRKLRPLLSLMPYLARYRWRAIAALVVLVIAAITTLVVPIAVRRMIDFGFAQQGASLIDSYFAVLIGIVAVLALSSAARFYLVTTLGERIVADLREGVFGHLISLSPAYFDAAKTGELISRLTADTTQIKAAVGASISVALRNVVLFVGASAMMVVTSPRLSAFVLAAIPVIVLPLYGFGRAVRRRSRAAQDTLADATAYASELLGAVRVLQAFTNEALANSRFGAAVERAFVAARELDPGPRYPHRDCHLSRVRQRGRGALGRRAGRTRRPHERRATVPIRALRRVRRCRAGPAFGGVGRDLAGVGCGRAAVRDLARAAGDRTAGAANPAAANRREGRLPSRMSAFRIRRGRRASCSTAYRFEYGRAKKLRSSVLRAPERARSFISSCGSTIPYRA